MGLRIHKLLSKNTSSSSPISAGHFANMQFWNWFFLATAVLTTAKPTEQLVDISTLPECMVSMTVSSLHCP